MKAQVKLGDCRYPWHPDGPSHGGVVQVETLDLGFVCSQIWDTSLKLGARKSGGCPSNVVTFQKSSKWPPTTQWLLHPLPNCSGLFKKDCAQTAHKQPGTTGRLIPATLVSRLQARPWPHDRTHRLGNIGLSVLLWPLAGCLLDFGAKP